MGLNTDAARRRHLVSSYAAALHLLDQMELAATKGQSPSGVGAPLTPLPHDYVQRVLDPLRELTQCFRQALEELASSELGAFETPQGPGATILWLSSLIDRMGTVVDGIQPRAMHNYGSGSEQEEARLAKLHEELSARVAEARKQLGLANEKLGAAKTSDRRQLASSDSTQAANHSRTR